MPLQDWVIFIEECLPDFGIELPSDKVIELAQCLLENADNINEMAFMARGGRSTDTRDYKRLYEVELKVRESAERDYDLMARAMADKCRAKFATIERGSVKVYDR